MKKMKTKLEQIYASNEFWLVAVSVIFGLIVATSKIARDDIYIYESVGKGVKDWWKWAVDQYYTWSSRQLINFIWAAVLRGGRIAWMMYMAVSMYVALKAMLLLFAKDNKRELSLYVICMLMIFPFDTLMSAGWVATTTSYFGPQAFALMSLVPIRKVFYKEPIKWWELLLYSICLLYGANAEQLCVVILGIYVVATVYFAIKKKNNWKIWLLLLLSVGSMVYMFICPGNWQRDILETANWFPTYGMMDTIDKADIGLSTTLKWMFADGNAFIIVTCIMMAVFIWEKYKEPLFRGVAVIPVAATILFGPLNSVFSSLFPYAAYASREIDYYGAFTVAAAGKGAGMVQFSIFLAIAMCICVEIILLNDKVEGIVTDIAFIIMGVASRAMMGFSPTVYASNTRTYTTLVVCIMAVSIHIYSENIVQVRNEKGVGKVIMYGLIVTGFANLIFLVVTALY